MNKNWYKITAQADQKAEILIYEQIGEDFFGDGISAEGFATELKALGELDEITVRINSPGGNVFDGNAIFNILRAHKATIIVAIDGIAASIASVIAMAGDKIIMPENAMMMIHDPSGLTMGTAEDMRKAAAALDQVKLSLMAAYNTRVDMAHDELNQMMKDETWLTAVEAVDLGFADEVAEPVRFAAKFDLSMFKHPPKNLTGSNTATVKTAGVTGITATCHKEKSTMTETTPTPEQIEAYREEGREEIRATIPGIEAKAESRGLIQGAKNEVERCAAIKGALIPGHESLINEMIADGKTTGVEALQRVVAAENALRQSNHDKLKADGEAVGDIGSATPDNVVNIDQSLPLEERCTAEWNADPKLRAEFSGGLESYIACVKAETAGQVKVHG